MKILIVTKGYYPHGDATGAIVRNIAEAMTAGGHRVHVAALSGEKEDTTVTERKGERITNLYVPEMRSKAKLMAEIRKRPISAGRIILRRGLAEAEREARRTYRELSLYPPYVKAYRKFFREQVSNGEYDLVLITMMPQDAVWAWQKEGKGGKGTAWAVYQLDTYWNRGTDTEEHQEERKAFEKRMTEECAFVMTTPIIAEVNGKMWPELKEKWIASEFPMVKAPEGTKGAGASGKAAGTAKAAGASGKAAEVAKGAETSGKTAEVANSDAVAKSDDGPAQLVFTGTLYPGLRPPEQVVAIIAEMKRDSETAKPDSGKSFLFDFYGGHQEMIEASPAYGEAKKRIVLHGAVSSEEAEEARNGADFLINIDNLNPTQVPSKIFEYLSTGKPIINFVFDEGSPIMAYLKDYPLCLKVNVNGDPAEAAGRVAAFVREKRGARIPFETVREMFERCTPEYVAKQIETAYLNHCG